MLRTLRTRLNQLEEQGFFPIFALTACIQGTVIASQLLVTFFLNPSEVGVIRSLESSLSVLILVGSFGAQALSIRDVAAHKAISNQLMVLRNIYLIVLLGALLMIAGVFAVREILHKSFMLNALFLASGVVFLTNAIRATSGFAQGAGLVRKMYLLLVPLSIVAVVIQLVLAARLGISGWIMGRYLSEGVMLLGAGIFIYRSISLVPIHAPINWEQIRRLGYNGILVNSALMLRVVTDSLPVLILTALKIPTDQIGYFGLAALAMTTASLPLAIVAQRALPIMVMSEARLETIIAQTRDLARLILNLALGGSVILTAGSMLLFWLVGGRYALAFLFTAVLCWSLSLKGLALAYGTLLMVKRDYSISIWINVIEAALVASTGLVTISRWGTAGAICAVAVGSLWSMTAYRIAARRHFA